MIKQSFNLQALQVSMSKQAGWGDDFVNWGKGVGRSIRSGIQSVGNAIRSGVHAVGDGIRSTGNFITNANDRVAGAVMAAPAAYANGVNALASGKGIGGAIRSAGNTAQRAWTQGLGSAVAGSNPVAQAAVNRAKSTFGDIATLGLSHVIPGTPQKRQPAKPATPQQPAQQQSTAQTLANSNAITGGGFNGNTAPKPVNRYAELVKKNPILQDTPQERAQRDAQMRAARANGTQFMTADQQKMHQFGNKALTGAAGANVAPETYQPKTQWTLPAFNPIPR